MRSARLVGDALVACLGAPTDSLRRGRLLASVDPDELLTAAEFHGVESWVHRAATSASTVPDLVARLAPVRLRHRLVLSQTAADLSVVAAAFDGASIPWLTFKGPVLDEVIHRPPHQRSYGDIDLLVGAVDLGQALGALEALGATVLDRNWGLLVDEHSGEVHVRLPHGSPADLHWHFFAEARDQNRFAVPMDEVLARRRMVQIGDMEVPTLDKVDTLVHVALHAAHHGGDRLLWLKDIEQCVLHEAPPWDATVARCNQWGVSLAVATMLDRTSRVLGLALPGGMLRSLGYRPPWSTLARSLDRLEPTPQALGDRSLTRMMTVVAGKDQWRSILLLAQRGAWAATHWSYGRPDPRDSSDQYSPLHPTGGPDGRAQYLAAVADQQSRARGVTAERER